MILCVCHPFSDKDARAHLQKCGGTGCRVAELYEVCSGGKRPNCCRCLPAIKDMVKAHNSGQPA